MRLLAAVAAAVAMIHVPHGYRVQLYASGLVHPTAMAFGPDRRLYVTEDVGRVVSVLRGSRRPRRVAARIPTPLGLVWVGRRLYVSAQGRLLQVRPTLRTVVAGLPFGLHQQDNVVWFRGRLVFGSGSTCDACRERDPHSAAILSVRPNGTGLRVVARGLRNPYGLVVDGRRHRLYASVNGRDRLGRSEPAEMVVQVRSGAFYGWPACWPSWRRRRLTGLCRGVARPLAYLEPHSSADGMALWHGDLFVAEWGEYLHRLHGRHVVRIRLDRHGRVVGESVFLTGLPHPLALATEGNALLVADWQLGAIYRIVRRR
jgi:glucose/arabinose dehydrogenase